MNQKDCRRKPSLTYYLGIYLEGLSITKNLSQDNQSPSQHLNPRPPEYKAEVLLSYTAQ
jgi:hypothetical protein